MSEAKHTPGPWELGHVTTVDIDTDEPVPSRDAGWVTMGDENEADISGPDAPANARLIAAAPDLLEALQGMLDIKNGDEITKARAAVAKALKS